MDPEPSSGTWVHVGASSGRRRCDAIAPVLPHHAGSWIGRSSTPTVQAERAAGAVHGAFRAGDQGVAAVYPQVAAGCRAPGRGLPGELPEAAGLDRASGSHASRSGERIRRCGGCGCCSFHRRIGEVSKARPKGKAGCREAGEGVPSGACDRSAPQIRQQPKDQKYIPESWQTAAGQRHTCRSSVLPGALAIWRQGIHVSVQRQRFHKVIA
mmetsp:Transcript_125219/g.227098  ORF Transcript_125219/g.227098 Transcript_125219/m.227098 type:complete len:211 (-) Transcript_125219:1005-1637(-)